MSSVSELSRFAHDLGIVNIDGVVFRKKVTYYDEDGRKLQLTDEFLAQECSITGQVEKQLTNYVAAVAKEHVKKAGKELKDTQLIVINSNEVSIDGDISKGHDFDLSDDTQTSLRTNLKEDIKTAAKTWELAHDILINDFDHHINCSSRAKLTFSGELDDTVRPHRAELSLHRVNKDDGSHTIPSAPSSSSLPDYEEVLRDDSSPSVTVVEEKRHVPASAPLVTSAPPVVEEHVSKPSLLKAHRDVTLPLRVPPVIGTSPDTPYVVGHVQAPQIAPVLRDETLPLIETVPVKEAKPVKTFKSLPKLLSELKGPDLQRLQPYLQYFHPFHWENVIEIFKGYELEADKVDFLTQCEKLKQETLAVKATSLSSPVMLATDANLLDQVSPGEREVYKRVFKAIDAEDKSVHTESAGRSHQIPLTEAESQREKQLAKAKVVKQALAHRKMAEEQLQGTHAEIDQSAVRDLHDTHERHLEHLERFATAQGVPKGSTKEDESPVVNLEDISLPVIMLYDKEKKEHVIVEENTENLKASDVDVKARKLALNTYLDDSEDIHMATQDFINTLDSIYQTRKRAHTVGDKSAISQIIERYQLHLTILEEQYRQVATSKGLVFKPESFTKFKGTLDAKFKSFVLGKLRNEVASLDKPNAAGFFENKKKKTVATDESKAFIKSATALYFETAKKLKTLGPIFHKGVEGIIATNGSRTIVDIDNVDSASKFIVSVLDPRHTELYSDEANAKAIHEAVIAS